jgi:diguanylate cyclase (GGDEF)-like protein
MSVNLLRRAALCLLLCLCPLLSLADTAKPALAGGVEAHDAKLLRGTPLLRRFTPEDYNASPQQLALTTDADGRLYVGNIEGVLRYDGETWDLITLPGKAIGRDVVTGADGRIYVGSYDSFGVLQTTAAGEVKYQELLTAAGLTGAERDVGIIWDVIPTAQGVYFRAERSLLFLSYDGTRHNSWPLAESTRSFYAVGEDLYARVAGVGFCRFVEGKFIPEPGAEVFADQPLPGVIPKDGWLLLVGDRGLYRSDADGIVPLDGDAGAELRDSDAYEVLALRDGSFVVATLRGELLRFGTDYQLRERVNLGSYGIVALAADREGGLWAATEGDLVRMALPSPWSFIGPAQGLPGTALDFEWYRDELWVATSRGFVRMHADHNGRVVTRETDWIDFEAYALLGTQSGLLLGHRNGLMVLDPGKDEPRELFAAEQEGIFELVASKADPDLVYGVSEKNLFLIQRRDGLWQLGPRISLVGASAGGLIETDRNVIWFGDGRGGPQRWRIDPAKGARVSREVFGDAQGLELDEHSGSFIYEIDGQIHAVSGENGFRFDGKRFVRDTGPPFTLFDKERANELVVEETPLGAYAFTTRQLWFREPGSRQWQPLHLGSQLAAGLGALRYNADGVVRVSTWSGLLQYSAGEPASMPAPLELGFDAITATGPDGRETALPVSPPEKPVEIPSGSRLHFRYGLVSMDAGLQFRYRLHGSAAEEWSSWTDRDRDLYVRAVTPGDYVLEVEARTRTGRLAAPVSYRYKVMPQWHERLWVRLLLLLALAAVAALAVQEFIRRRTERYREANRRLEARIAERTHELEEVNRKLAEIATEDALTGVANRRALEQGLQREWLRCLDQRRPLSVLMIDVDHFKRYNDAHGHLEGDVLLRAIAQRLQTGHDPRRELLARYGGEEFALLLPGVHLEEATRRAEQIRQVMAGAGDGVTVSIGAAGFVPSVQAEPNSLLRRADAALYRAKRAGRNRVEIDADPVINR